MASCVKLRHSQGAKFAEPVEPDACSRCLFAWMPAGCGMATILTEGDFRRLCRHGFVSDKRILRLVPFSEVTTIDLAIFWVVCTNQSLSKQTHLRIYPAPLAAKLETATRYAAAIPPKGSMRQVFPDVLTGFPFYSDEASSNVSARVQEAASQFVC